MVAAEAEGSGVWHWQGGIGSAASALAGGRIGGGQDGVGGVRMSAVGGRVSVVGVWCHGRGQGGGCSPQQSQFFMWPIGKMNCQIVTLNMLQ